MSRLLNLDTLIADVRARAGGTLAFTAPSTSFVNAFFRPLTEAERTARFQNAYTIGNPPGVTGAMGLTTNVYEQILAKTMDVRFPELKWQTVIPAASIDTSINVGAKMVSYRVKDWRGKATWRSPGAQDIPRVGVGMNKVLIPIEEAAIMATVDVADLESVAFGFEGMNLITDNGIAMRKAHDYHIEETVFFGDASVGFAGYLDYPLIPVMTASTKAAGGTTWANATPQEMINDVMNAIGTVFQATKNIFLPNVIRLPFKQWMQLSNTRIGGVANDVGGAVNQSVLQYLQTNNFFTAQTGQPLRIEGLRYLEGAGVGGTDRLIAEVDDADAHYLPMPLPFTTLPPQDRQYATDIFSRWRVGSYHKPFPNSAIYMDGI